MSRAVATAAALAALVLPVGCALIAGLDGDDRLAPASTSTSTSTGAGGDAAACKGAGVPGPPSGSGGGASGGGGGGEIVVAMRALDLGEGINAGKVGLDLDGACTCPGAPSCTEPAWASGDHCDGAEGRDNAAAQGFAIINGQVPGAISSGVLRAAIGKGDWSLLFRVRGYDGGPDDGQVEVATYVTTGLSAEGKTPAWDGNDTWPVAASSLVDQVSIDEPIAVDAKAYVTGGVLVAHLSTLALLVLGDNVRLGIRLSSVTLSGRIEPGDAGGMQISEGVIAGTWTLPDLFLGLSDLRFGGSSKLCRSSGIYLQIRDTLCSVADIDSAPAMGDLCDSLSFGMSFQASPAKLGAVMPVPPPSGAPCTADEGDPKDDSCGTL